MESRVWCPPQNSHEINLNITAQHSEIPLKDEGKTSTLSILKSTDFLLSSNLTLLLSQLKDSTDSKILPPRENCSLASSSTFQTSDQLNCSLLNISGPQDVIPIKNARSFSGTQSNEFEPEDKEQHLKPIYSVVPWNTDSVLEEWGIDCREEIINTNVNTNGTKYDQYRLGEIVYGSSVALEHLSRDCAGSKLKTGTHGVITNPKFEFMWNPKCSFKNMKLLGRGGNGTVELCSYNNVEFVTKTVTRDFRPNEVLFTNTLSHEFIVKSHGLIVRNGSPQIIMDYAGDNLLHYGLSRVLYENEIWDITYQILEALNYLHSKKIRHFDVKPENIVLLEDHEGHKTLKLADFGGATGFEEEVDCLSWTPAYMSPEMDQFYLKRQFPGQKLITTSCGDITEKCDIYSLALSILFLYVRGHILIKHVTQGSQALVGQEKADAVSMNIVILNAQNPGLAESLIPANVGQDMRTLLTGMLKGNVVERLTAKDAMDLMQASSEPVLSQKEIVQQPKRIIRRKSRSTEIKARSAQNVQAIRPKTPKLVIVTLDTAGRKVSEYSNAVQEEQKKPQIHRFGQNFNHLEIEEQQRPLRDLNVDLQLRMIMEQSESVNDEKLKQVIDEENRPLLKRLIKRKLKDKVYCERAFKMTRMMEELDSTSSTSTDCSKENLISYNISGSGHVVMSPSESHGMAFDEGPGNVPNFDMFFDL